MARRLYGTAAEMFGCVGFLLYALCGVVIFGGLIYAAWHFIAKFW